MHSLIFVVVVWGPIWLCLGLTASSTVRFCGPYGCQGSNIDWTHANERVLLTVTPLQCQLFYIMFCFVTILTGAQDFFLCPQGSFMMMLRELTWAERLNLACKQEPYFNPCTISAALQLYVLWNFLADVLYAMFFWTLFYR